MKRVILKLAFLMLPAAALYGFTLFVLLRGGELISVEEVISRQMAADKLVLYGLAYIDRDAYYKNRAVLRRLPEILILGASRMGMFRSKFFKDPPSFYNAAVAVTQIGSFTDFRIFLDSITKDDSPKIIIMGLEQFYFNGNWMAKQKVRRRIENANVIYALLGQTHYVWADYIKGKFSLAGLRTAGIQGRSFIGINAIFKHVGFRNDGSIIFGKPFAYERPGIPSADPRFMAELTWIIKGIKNFEYSAHISASSLSELKSLLESCKDRKIYVVGILPPYAKTIYDKLISTPDRYGYIQEIAPAVSKLFDRYGYSFYDFSDLSSVGSSDVDMVDGFHMNEKACLRLFLTMLKSDRKLREVAADEKYLIGRLAGSGSASTVFGDDEF